MASDDRVATSAQVTDFVVWTSLGIVTGAGFTVAFPPEWVAGIGLVVFILSYVFLVGRLSGRP